MNFQESDEQQTSDCHSFKMVMTSDLSCYTACLCLILLQIRPRFGLLSFMHVAGPGRGFIAGICTTIREAAL